MKKIFGNLNLTWKNIIISAILIAIYTSFVALLPITENTSFRDISINFEWWILFGILIIINGKSPMDSSLKCFVFFLISQPLIYLFQVPFSDKGFALFYYYRYWFIWTLLTLPMGYIGYYIKKNNILSAIILVPMLLILFITGFEYYNDMISNFPYHILSFISCFVILLVIVFNVLSTYKLRIISLVLTIIISLIYFSFSNKETDVKYVVYKNLNELNVSLFGEVNVIQHNESSIERVDIICDEDYNCNLKLTGLIGNKYSFILKDEKNNEYLFDYQYTNKDGLILNMLN